MGTFQVTNNTTGLDSGASGSVTINPNDWVSLYYNVGFDLSIPNGTRIYFAVQELNRYLQTSGGDTLNTSGWANPNLAEQLPAGTYHFYAFDGITGAVSNIVTVVVTGAPAKPTITQVSANVSADNRVNLQWYQDIAGSIRAVVDNTTVLQGVGSAGWNTGQTAILNILTVGSHNVCVEAV